jgi:hypothetical protein
MRDRRSRMSLTLHPGYDLWTIADKSGIGAEILTPMR